MSSRETMLKVVIVGETGVGKTSILRRFGFSEFREDYLSTIGADFITKKVEINNEDINRTVTLQIWDTAGQERFLSLGCAFYRGADACIIVYDINNTESFNRIERWREEFLNQVQPPNPDDFPFIIAANKIDNIDSAEMKEFNVKRALNWIHMNFRDSNIFHIPVSAKEDESIGVLFATAAEMSLGKKYQLVPSIDDSIVDLRDLPLERVCMLAGNTVMHPVECDIRARVVDFVAEVTVTHKFVNPLDTEEEGVYLLPLASNELICGFSLSIKGEQQSCNVESIKALEKLPKGRGAYLTREDFDDVYTCYAGLIPGQAEVAVSCKYLTETTLDQYGNIVIVIPKSISPIISPNYYKNDDYIGSVPEDVERKLSVFLEMVMPTSIQEVSSPSHPIETPDLDGTSIQSSATLKQEVEELELQSDFIVKCGLESAAASRLWLEYNGYDSSYAAMAMFSPLEESTFDEDKKYEILFVVQNTKSMSLFKEALDDTMKLLIHSIPPNSAFNVISYASRVSRAFDVSAEFNQQNMEKALEYIDSLRMEDCEAELVSAVQSVLEQKPVFETGTRVAVIITDGYISTTQNLFLEVRKHATSTKIYAVGIYNPLGEHLVKGFARAARTSAEFIDTAERPESKIILQFKRSVLPACENIKFSWNTKNNAYVPSLTWPSNFPDVFGGNFVQTLTIFEPNNVSAENGLEGTLEISTTFKDHNMVSTLDVDMYPEQQGRMLHRLTAWKLIENHIKDLKSVEEGTLESRRSGTEHQALQLAEKYSLITDFSCVVSEKPTESGTHLCMAKGWQAIRQVSADINLCFAHSFDPTYDVEEEDVYQPRDVNLVRLNEQSQSQSNKGCCLRKSKDPEPAAVELQEPRPVQTLGRVQRSHSNSTPESPQTPMKTKPQEPPKALQRSLHSAYMSIVNLQQYKGNWTLNDDFAQIFGMRSDQLRAEKPLPDQVSDVVWATGLGLCHLVMVHSDHAGECELIRLKAYHWLRDNAGESVAEVVEAASNMVEKANRKLSLSMRRTKQKHRPSLAQQHDTQ